MTKVKKNEKHQEQLNLEKSAQFPYDRVSRENVVAMCKQNLLSFCHWSSAWPANHDHFRCSRETLTPKRQREENITDCKERSRFRGDDRKRVSSSTNDFDKSEK